MIIFSRFVITMVAKNS